MALVPTGFHLILDTNGKTATEIRNKSIDPFFEPCEQLIVVRNPQNNLSGFMDFDEKMVIPPKFSEVSAFKEKLARVLVSNGREQHVGFINRSGDFVIQPVFPIDSELVGVSTDFSEGIAFVPADYFVKKLAINAKGEIQFEFNAFAIEPMIDGRAAFCDDKAVKWGFIDNLGNVKIRPQYKYLGDFGSGLAVVAADDADDTPPMEVSPDEMKRFLDEMFPGNSFSSFGLGPKKD